MTIAPKELIRRKRDGGALTPDELREVAAGIADGGLTDAGSALRAEVEATTDRLAVPGWAHLGADGTQRLVELLAPLRERLFDS